MILRTPTPRITRNRTPRAIHSPHGPRPWTPAAGRASRLTRMAGFLVGDTCGGGQP
jgi:hypothetical protein